jgi:hypothetical protein
MLKRDARFARQIKEMLQRKASYSSQAGCRGFESHHPLFSHQNHENRAAKPGFVLLCHIAAT